MTFEEYMKKVVDHYLLGGVRWGQAYWNVLTEADNDLANDIRGRSIDPFYDDARLGDFLYYIQRKWS